ncbi:MAG: N(4)-(beta-N-acetylglucosaminyl)-L-asparaginase [Saprospiraceae bacterium]|nr:N(4)-(beta-N-acetylglucosaminyl)-L-asparaginase [Saprospiraceae bacterium]
MSKSIKRRSLLKLFPAAALLPTFLTTQTLYGCAPKEVDGLNSIFISTWNNINANNVAAGSATEGNNVIDAIVDGISFVESDIKDMSVGKGGRPDRDGDVTLDACMMDHKGEAGGVCFMQHIEHPIQVAKEVMYSTPHVLLAGEGATQFAISKGHKKTDLLTEESKSQYKEWLKEKKYQPIPNIEQHDTIGMLGLHKGILGGGCSTSGLAYKLKGRVGDSPIIGAGLYVDGEVGACTATGMGEIMLKNLSSFLVVEFMKNGDTPQIACEKAIKRIADKIKGEKKDQQVGLLAIDVEGNTGGFSVLPGFTYAKTVNGKTEVVKCASFFS